MWQLRFGGILLIVEGCLVTLFALGSIPMMGFAADPGTDAAVSAYLFLGTVLVWGVISVVTGALAMRRHRVAAWVGIGLSLVAVGVGVFNSSNVGPIGAIAVGALLAFPAIYLALGLVGPMPWRLGDRSAQPTK